MRWNARKFARNLTNLLLIICLISGGAALLGYAIDQEIERQDQQVLDWLDDLPVETRLNYINN